MRFLFDLEALQFTNYNKFDGGAEYAKVVFFALLERIDSNDFYLCFNPNKKIPDDVDIIIKSLNLKLIEKKSNSDLNRIFKLYNIDKFYSALPYMYKNVDFTKIKESIVTIHGLRPIELPFDFYEYKYANNPIEFFKSFLKIIFYYLYKKMLKYNFTSLFRNLANTKIIAVSEHTKYSICTFYPAIKPNQITCLYSPLKKYETSQKLLYWDSLKLEINKYFLIISVNRWIKNSYRALKAFDHIFKNYKDFQFKVLCLGCIKNQFKKEFNSDKFIFVDYVNSNNLEYFYENCYAFIYPTLNEGFGYPPLEAMKYGKPVLSSYVNSITEICKDAPLYFNPYSVHEISNRILNIVNDSILYEKMKNKSLERYYNVKVKQENDLNKLVEILIS